MGNENSSAKKKAIPRNINPWKLAYNDKLIPKNMKKWKLGYTDDVLIDADMQMPVYRPLDEANQPTFQVDNDAIWIRRDESYWKPQRVNPTPNTITKETVLDGAGWYTVSDDNAESVYDTVGDVSYGSSKDVIALQRFQIKLTVFRKVFVATINIHKILPDLSFVEYPHDFKRIAKRNTSAAVELLIDRLLETNVSNHRIIFISGLQRCGYEHLHRLLDVNDDINTLYQNKYISIMADVIKPLIAPSKVTCYLWSTGVLNDADVKLIHDAEVSEGVEHAVDILLDRIQHRHAFWYSHFVDALKHADLIDAVELLDIPQLHTGCAGSNQSGSQSHSTTSVSNLPSPPPLPPSTTQRQAILRPLSRPFMTQNQGTMAQSCVQQVSKEREYIQDMETDVNDSETYSTDPKELYDDTALPPVKVVKHITENTMHTIVYLPEGHSMPLGFLRETAVTTNYTNDSADSGFVQVNRRDTIITDSHFILDDWSDISSTDSAFIQVERRDTSVTDSSFVLVDHEISVGDIYDMSSVGFAEIERTRSNSVTVTSSQATTGKILSKPPYPLPKRAFLKPPPSPTSDMGQDGTDQLYGEFEYGVSEEEPPPLPARDNAKEETPPPLPARDKAKDFSEFQVTSSKSIMKSDDSYKQADHTHTELRNEQVIDVNYKPDETYDDGRQSNISVNQILTENDIAHENESVELTQTTTNRENDTSFNALDIASIHTFSRETLLERIRQLKHEQNDDREKTELLNNLAEEINNLSLCKVNKIEAFNNIKKADDNLKTQQSKLASVIRNNTNSGTRDEYPSEGIYSARQLEEERQGAANTRRNMPIAVCLNNIQTHEFTARSQIPLSHNSFKNCSCQILPKIRRSSLRDSAFYSGSNIDPLYKIPEQD